MDRTKIVAAGAIETEAYFTVIAETPRGERYVLVNGIFPTQERAEKFAAKVIATGDIDLAHWVDTYPRYGSDAYEDEASEAHEAAEMIRGGHAHESDYAGTRIGTLL